MNKSVLVSIRPYYAFLIIAHKMGWDTPQEKLIESRKDYPKDEEWNKVVHIYCSKDKKSFDRIPVQYQPIMEKFLGRVVSEFVCDMVYKWGYDYCDGVDIDDDLILDTCLDREDINIYAKGKTLYGWHISDLKIYDKPKELSEFKTGCKGCKERDTYHCKFYCCSERPLTRPPQSWCYCE